MLIRAQGCIFAEYKGFITPVYGGGCAAAKLVKAPRVSFFSLYDANAPSTGYLQKVYLYRESSEILPLTSKLKALHLPTHVVIQPNAANGLSCPSMILAEQVTTINIAALIKKLGCLQRKDLIRTGKARQAQSHFPTE